MVSEHTLTLVPIDDGLKHRPRPQWAIVYMTCELNDAEVWLKSALPEESGKEVSEKLYNLGNNNDLKIKNKDRTCSCVKIFCPYWSL